MWKRTHVHHADRGHGGAREAVLTAIVSAKIRTQPQVLEPVPDQLTGTLAAEARGPVPAQQPVPEFGLARGPGPGRHAPAAPRIHQPTNPPRRTLHRSPGPPPNSKTLAGGGARHLHLRPGTRCGPSPRYRMTPDRSRSPPSDPRGQRRAGRSRMWLGASVACGTGPSFAMPIRVLTWICPDPRVGLTLARAAHGTTATALIAAATSPTPRRTPPGVPVDQRLRLGGAGGQRPGPAAAGQGGQHRQADSTAYLLGGVHQTGGQARVPRIGAGHGQPDRGGHHHPGAHPYQRHDR